MAKEGKRDITTMSRYSAEQQMRIVKLFIEDADFRKKVAPVIDQNAFNTDESIRVICSIAIELENKGVEPTYHIIETYVNSTISDAFRLGHITSTLILMKSIPKLSPDEVEFLKNDVYGILVWQEARKLEGGIKEILKNRSSNFDRSEILDICNEFEKNTSFTSLGYVDNDMSKEQVKELFTSNGYEKVSTTSKILDDMLDGGLRKGDVGIFLAGSGVAKTCMTTSFVCGAAWRGLKAAHIVLEDKKEDIQKKYVAFVTGISSGSFEEHEGNSESIVDEYYDKIHKMAQNIKSVYCTEQNGRIRSMTVKDIDRELNRMCIDGFHPDLVVIDYFDRLDKGRGDIWVVDQRTINDLLDLATKYNVALWCPSQGSKAAQNPNSPMDLTTMSGGAWKSFGAQIVVAAQRCEDEGPYMFKLKTLKNRYATPNVERLTKFNNGTCRFDEKELIAKYKEQNSAIDQMFQYNMATKVKNNYNQKTY